MGGFFREETGGGSFPDVFSKSVLTEDDLIYILDNKLFYPVFIGSEVEIYNKVRGRNDKYLIIDMNHDDTTDTFDLQCLDVFNNINFGSSNNNYGSSTINNYLNNTYYKNYFNSIKPYIKPMSVVCGTSTLTGQYAKLLSVKEVGYKATNAYVEGNEYPFLKHYLKYSDNYQKWWLRTPYINDNSKVFYVTNTGSITTQAYSAYSYVCPCFRVGA